ncbi:putative methylesterase 11, chloroplastic isoform X1 [Elaeis guineensis]|uniref:Methylesterase 11, chloroplastic isoform X1 n=1 Tax=Elaeis guineensis var. tenera TaxID=51953 RepID=A0A6I9S936_ELAGV|nr:putative methylesterase 11, chloroplastic isoform X1 [Elaeis guineensis]
MGSLVSCFSAAEETKRPPPPHRRSVLNAPPKAARGLGSSERWSKGRAGRKERAEEAMIHEQAAAAAEAAPALLAPQNGGVLPFDRSSSLRYPGHGQKKQALPRSSSSRARSFTDQVVQPQQLVNQDLKIDNLETNHFVLVHGGGFGAWCWYKTIALLEDSGFKVNAIDLTGSGIHSFDTNKITTLPEYVQPLTSFLESLGDGEKVILVGHDFGGACISYAMEMFPSKIAKAVFLCAAMLTSGQSTLDMFSQQADTNDLMQQAQIFVYANGNDHPPTAIDLNKSSLKELLFNQSPAKDVALALVSMRPIPFAPVLEKLSLTDKNYGSVRRFYIETTEDNALLISLQQNMCSSNPPERIFRLKGADHSPFFSKPQALNKLLIEISKITSPEAQ